MTKHPDGQSATGQKTSEPEQRLVPLDEFVESLTGCGLMTRAEVQSFIQGLPPDKRPTNGKQLAEELFRQKKLTRFQAQTIYQGRTRGLVVGNYVVLDRLGSGGMGQVYKAQHRRLERVVAIKILPAAATTSEDSVKRFQREVKTAAKLTHPNIVTAYDADEHKGVHFLVMEYVEGQDLASLVKDSGPVAVATAVDYVLQAARGLAYAHGQGVVHRDIKPANLLVDKRGTVKVLDMGLARMDQSVAQDDGLTRSGQVMGTLDYMAPEQAYDAHQADVPADIYSLGCTLYYLLAGQPPFAGETLTQKILAHREHPAPSLRAARRDVPEWVEAVFQKMLAKQPENRYSTMRDVISAFEQQSLPQVAPVAAPTVTPAVATETLSPQQVSVDTSSEQWPVPPRRPRPVSKRSPWTTGLARVQQTTVQWFARCPRTAIALAAGLLFFAVLLGVLLTLRTKEGTLVVEVHDPDLTIQVLNEQGEVLVERKAVQERVTIRIDPGQRRLRLEKNGVVVFSRDITLASGGREVITAKLEPAIAGKTKTDDPNAEKQVSPRAKWASDAPPLAKSPFNAAQARQHQQAWAQYAEAPVEFTNSIGMKLVLIPAGEFLMGSPDSDSEAFSSERPQHLVRITKPFYVGLYEVTQGQYQRVVGNNPSKVEGESLPVDTVLWQDAEAFCQRLSELPTEQAAGHKYRLPTEAEWEYACRAGSASKYCFGDSEQELGSYAWYADNSSNKTHPVGTKLANAWGLYDMHGNAWEWCADWFRPYERGTAIDPMGSRAASHRVSRSGGGSCIARGCRSAARFMPTPSEAGEASGFRVALSPSTDTDLGEPAVPAERPSLAEATPKSPEQPRTPLTTGPSQGQPPVAVAPFDATKARQHQRRWAEYLGRTVEFTNAINMKFVLVPPGEFVMGAPDSDEDAETREKPQHRVRVTKPFYLGMHEVTQAQYLQVTGTNPSVFKQSGENAPVEYLSCEDADAFCDKLASLPSEAESRRRYRLPTEAEWEYACRAGSTMRYGLDDSATALDTCAWYTDSKNSRRTTHPVGQKEPNAWGLYDMLGNVSEWCQDWYHGYSPGFQLDPRATTVNTGAAARINRGGACGSPAKDCRSSFRGMNSPRGISGGLGFRVLMEIPIAEPTAFDSSRESRGSSPLTTDKNVNPQKGNEPNDASNPPPVPQSPVQTIAVLANDAELGYVKPMPEASPQILLRLDAKSGEWRRLESRAKLKNGDRLQVLPGSFPEIVLSPGVLVAMGGPSQFRPVATSLPDQTGFTIDYGRIFVASTGVPGARIHLDLAGWRCIISIADAASDLAVEVQQYLPPGDDPEKAPRQRVVQVFCTAGRVQCEDAVSNTTTWLEKGQMKTIVGDRSQTAAARTIPSWVRREGLRDVERIAAASLNASLTADRTVALFLQERSHDRKPEVRSLVARCLVCLELYDAVLADLADEKQRDFWAADIDALRQSMSRRSESALRVREALERVNSAEASKLYRILWSYSPEQLREGGGAAELVTLLDHDSLMVRVLAFETLRRITGKDYLYRPGGSTSQRRTARMLWWGALQKGEVIYTTMPSPLWSEK